jgi:hypothetical protein
MFIFATFNMRYWLQTTKDQAIGTNYTLTVNATNAQTYQWYKNNVAIAGETTKTYSKSVSASDAGTYKVVITNGCGYSIFINYNN